MANIGSGITLRGRTVDYYAKRIMSFERLKRWAWAIVRAILLIGISYIILYPIIVQFTQAIMSREDMFDATVRFIPKNVSLHNFVVVINTMKYWEALLNSSYITLVTTVLQLISCTLAGYGFARFKFWGREILFALVIFTIIVPPQTITTSLYLHFRYFDIFGIINFFTGKRGLNLIDTVWPFFLPAATCMGIRNGLYIFIMRQFFRGMPKELEEAALVDGCGVFKTFYLIMLRPAVPALTTVLLFSVVWQYNDIFYVNLFLNVTKFRVMTSALQMLPVDMLALNASNVGLEQGATVNPLDRVRWLATGSILSLIPLIVLYIFAQRYFVESIERTGIVG